MKPRSFRTQAHWRAWLEKNHAKVTELTVRLFKVHARDRGIGYREALDEALCYGWIDGIKKSLDADSFTHRFTPRKARSNWSAVNIERAKELIAEGRMCAPGLAAYERRGKTAAAPYSYENRNLTLDAASEKIFRANRKAWEFFQALPPWYRRQNAFHIASAKKEETRAKRLADLIDRCARGITRQPMSRPK